MPRREGTLEVGARVGDEVALEGGGSVVGSKSRSGIVGDASGRFVVLSNRIRRAALETIVIKCFGVASVSSHLMTSRRIIPRHLIFSENFLRSPISIINSVNLMSSSVREAHLYIDVLSIQALVKRVWSVVGMRGW